jgi:putative ABC transport system permease protein
LIGLVWQSVRFARGRALALGAGLLVAAVAFSLLTSSVDATSARVNGVVGANWRGAYDLLVVPRGSVQSTKTTHLVQVNYLSADDQGITLAQYRKIASLPGVKVAAPLEIVGYVLETASVPVTLSAAAAGTSGARVLEVTSHYTADNGLSSFPSYAEGYVYVTPDRVTPLLQALSSEHGNVTGPLERLPSGKSIIICPASNSGAGARGLPARRAPASPFARDFGLQNGSCYPRTGQGSGTIQGFVQWSFPVLIAGIDPQAENELTGLGKAVTSGRYLRNGERPSPYGTSRGGVVVPVLGSSVSFDGDSDQVSVSLLPAAAVPQVRSGNETQIARSLSSDRRTVIQNATISGGQAWSDLLQQLSAPLNGPLISQAQSVSQYWTAGPVHYKSAAGTGLGLTTVDNPVSVWSDNAFSQQYVTAPVAAEDTGFRVLTEHQAAAHAAGGYVLVRAVGQFSPAKLGGFSGAGPGSPLASYRTPVLTGANARSRTLLKGQSLLPDGNMAGYAQMPPLLYTTLAGAAALENPNVFQGSSAQAAAPIGSVRVRVSGLRGSVRERLDKIGAIGAEIRKDTGLPVIVTAGASPHLVTINLPQGKFGRPELALNEDWTQTAVALVVLNQVDKESLALFVLILLVCGFFLGAASLASVRGRRSEIGTLRALGWGRSKVFAFALGEVTLLGLLAGIVGAGVSAALIVVLGLDVPLWRSLIEFPVAIVLAVLAGLVPAALAARTQPMEALAEAVRAPKRGGRRIRTMAGLAVAGMTRVPGRCVLAGAGLAFGVAGLAVLLAAQASFGTSIGDSELAGLVTATTRSTDLISAVLTVILSAAGLADVTYLNLRERSAELAALAASGWGRRQVGQLLGYEALLTAAGGSLVGGAAGLAAAGTAFGITGGVLAGVIGAILGGVLVSVIACGAVLVITTRRPIAMVLAADE